MTTIYDIIPWCVYHLNSMGFKMEEIMEMRVIEVFFISSMYINWLPRVDTRFN